MYKITNVQFLRETFENKLLTLILTNHGAPTLLNIPNITVFHIFTSSHPASNYSMQVFFAATVVDLMNYGH